MGLNCKIKGSYPAPKLRFAGDLHEDKCNYSTTGQLCDPEAGSFVNHCSKCNKTN